MVSRSETARVEGYAPIWGAADMYLYWLAEAGGGGERMKINWESFIAGFLLGALALKIVSNSGVVASTQYRGYGVPRTEEQRMATHYATYGTTELPPRGTGLQIVV